MANAADRKNVNEQRKAAKITEANRRAVITGLMDTESGRRFVWDRLEAAHMFSTSFSEDPIRMAFSEGERNQGLQLLNEVMQYCPEQFIQAMRESNERRSIDDIRTAAEQSGGEGLDGSLAEPSASSDGDSGPEYTHPGNDPAVQQLIRDQAIN